MNSRFLLIFLSFFCFFSKVEANIEDFDRPILLVHGYMANQYCWLYQKHGLRNGGFTNVYTVNLGITIGSIEDYAQKIAEKSTQIREETGREDLVLIGHSMGGIISAYYALQLAEEGSVTNLITLGSPWQGSHLAQYGVGTCAEQLAPESQLLSDMRELMGKARPFRFFQMAGDYDLIVFPVSSAFVDCPGAKTAIFPKHGHCTLLLSGSVNKTIIQHLTARENSGICYDVKNYGSLSE